MKIFLIAGFIFCITHFTYAQQTVDAIRKQATTLAQQQDFTGAVQVLDSG
ncbi:MAG TPA: hypothetical protein VGI61_11980 [Parafilimonas sp.]